jgi:3-methylcrotonyl-CoA carboxylase alpha subunit
VAHNGELVQRVLALPAFQQGRVHTHLIDDHQAQLLALPDDTALHQALQALARHLAQGAQQPDAADPWARGDGWRLHGVAHRQASVRWLDAQQPRTCALPAWHPRADAAHAAAPTDTAETTTVVPRPHHHGHRHGQGQGFDVFTHEGHFAFALCDPLQEAHDAAQAASQQASQQGTARLDAPMPGRVVAIDVQVGQAVQAGQRLAVTEAMKMEHALCAPHDGVVSDVLCAVGDAVAQGQPLLRLQAAAPAPPAAPPPAQP